MYLNQPKTGGFMEESDKAFDDFAVPESRNIPRSTTKSYAKVDFKKPHVPLLFMPAKKTISKGLNKRISTHTKTKTVKTIKFSEQKV